MLHQRDVYPRVSPLALGLVLLAHGAVVAMISIWRGERVEMPVLTPPLMVEVLKSSPPEVKPADITPPKPKPVAHREQPTRVPVVPVLATTPIDQQPAVYEVKPVPPQPLPPIQTQPAPPQSPAPVAAQAAPAMPTAPRFDADYLDNPKPVYPPISRLEREQGKVLLRVHVDAGGAADKVEMQAGSGFERLDKAAIAAVSRWRFVPARQGSEPVAAWVVVPIVFSLKD
jgi:protein TonB